MRKFLRKHHWMYKYVSPGYGCVELNFPNFEKVEMNIISKRLHCVSPMDWILWNVVGDTTKNNYDTKESLARATHA